MGFKEAISENGTLSIFGNILAPFIIEHFLCSNGAMGSKGA